MLLERSNVVSDIVTIYHDVADILSVIIRPYACQICRPDLERGNGEKSREGLLAQLTADEQYGMSAAFSLSQDCWYSGLVGLSILEIVQDDFLLDFKRQQEEWLEHLDRWTPVDHTSEEKDQRSHNTGHSIAVSLLAVKKIAEFACAI